MIFLCINYVLIWQSGDEMTRIIWKTIKDKVCLIFYNLCSIVLMNYIADGH